MSFVVAPTEPGGQRPEWRTLSMSRRHPAKQLTHPARSETRTPENDPRPLFSARRQSLEHQPAHRVGRVELVRDADEGELVLFEDFQQLGEIQERAAQSLDLLDHDTLDLPRLDIRDQTPQGRAIDDPSVEPPSSLRSSRQ